MNKCYLITPASDVTTLNYANQDALIDLVNTHVCPEYGFYILNTFTFRGWRFSAYRVDPCLFDDADMLKENPLAGELTGVFTCNNIIVVGTAPAIGLTAIQRARLKRHLEDITYTYDLTPITFHNA